MCVTLALLLNKTIGTGTYRIAKHFVLLAILLSSVLLYLGEDEARPEAPEVLLYLGEDEARPEAPRGSALPGRG